MGRRVNSLITTLCPKVVFVTPCITIFCHNSISINLAGKKTRLIVGSFCFFQNLTYPHPIAAKKFRAQIEIKILLVMWTCCYWQHIHFAKLMVRVQPPSFTPQPQVLLTDLVASIKKLGELSNSLESTELNPPVRTLYYESNFRGSVQYRLTLF